MPVRLHHIVIDTHDLPGLARFWTQALRWKVLVTDPAWTRRLTAPFTVFFRPWVLWPVLAAFAVVCWFVLIGKGVAGSTAEAFGSPGLLLLVFALGARRVDVGQTGKESWTVLADPEGNEFCVVRPKDTLVG